MMQAETTCIFCEWFNNDEIQSRCKFFPYGIPDEILIGEIDCRKKEQCPCQEKGSETLT